MADILETQHTVAENIEQAPKTPDRLQASGARMSRQTRFLREGVEDQLILEKAKGPDGMSREQIESRIVVPRHTIFVQFFPLYILPVIIIVAGYFFFTLLGFL